jgi:tetratricopeptide (TPR) repeat protein
MLIGACFNLKASYKSDIYKAFITNNMALWRDVIDNMQLQKDQSNSLKLELINYQYGYIAWCIGNNKSDEAEEYLTLAEEMLGELEEAGYNPSLIYSYHSAFYGYRIGLNLFLAPFIGQKSVDYAKLAIQSDDQNPYGYIQYGNSQYYMPAVFGGSKAVALDFFLRAEKLMEQNNMQIQENWNYLNLLTIIAQAYVEVNNYSAADTYYQKILRIEPNFLWVKNELYPQLLKKKNNRK